MLNNLNFKFIPFYAIEVTSYINDQKGDFYHLEQDLLRQNL